MRAVEAYVVAIALTVFATSVLIALLGGQPFLLAVAAANVRTAWTGLLGIVGLAALALPPAVATLAVVRGESRSRRDRALVGGALWAGWFVLIALVALAAGMVGPHLDWNPVLSAADIVVIAVAGGTFADLGRAPDLPPAIVPEGSSEPG